MKLQHSEEMTSRERILATLEHKPVDRYPVWLKMTNATWQAPQPEPVKSMGAVDLLRAAGCDLFLDVHLAAAHKSPRVEKKVFREGDTQTTTYITSEGTLTAVDRFSHQSIHPIQYPIQNREDLKILRFICEDRSFFVETKKSEEQKDKQQEMENIQAATASYIGPGPLMDLVEHWCGPVTTVFLMVDEPELFESTIQAMHECRVRELKAQLPLNNADTFWLTENTSTTLISPGMFEKYCVPHLREYSNLVLENGIIPIHHMCGTLNALLEQIDGLPAIANEAYTTYPLGDVSLEEGRARMPSKSLIGGTNATLWLEEPEVIRDTVAADLRACADRKGIFLTSAGVLPPLVSLEKGKKTVEMLKGLPL